jgi:hypothetical protein
MSFSRKTLVWLYLILILHWRDLGRSRKSQSRRTDCGPSFETGTCRNVVVVVVVVVVWEIYAFRNGA